MSVGTNNMPGACRPRIDPTHLCPDRSDKHSGRRCICGYRRLRERTPTALQLHRVLRDARRVLRCLNRDPLPRTHNSTSKIQQTMPQHVC